MTDLTSVSTSELVQELRKRITELEEAKALFTSAIVARRGRRVGGRRQLSAEARAKIAEAQRKRWRNAKKAA